MMQVPFTLFDILRWRAENQPHRVAYRFLIDGEFEEVVLTYGDLDRRARSIGALLQSSAKAGDRALLLFPPGLDFIVAFFGCLYSRIIAVPSHPPHHARLERTFPIIRRIAADANPSLALLTPTFFDGLKSQNEIRDAFGNMKLVVMGEDEMEDWTENWQQPKIAGNDIAFLQYTSGSTTSPRGVVVSHRNLFHNLGLIENCFGQSSKSHAVIWLPPYHDMGLVGGILQPLFTGYPATLISHLFFLQRPIRWLQAISRFQATTSGGPNFAYDLCTRRIRPEQRQLLDLSSWEVAFNGAEPVYHKTLEEFADYFAPCGFRREAILPCYGLAEATLLVAGGPKGRIPVIQNLVNSGLERNQVFITAEKNTGTRTLVSCGKSIDEHLIKIVNAETLSLCPDDQIGEIWVSGPSVADGYWNKPLETKLIFDARLSNSNEGPFLRTGDLGFLHEGELYITGRLKNLIISDGKNHHAHDLERTVERCHSAIRLAGCAVFSIIDSDNERIIVNAEIEQKHKVNGEEVIKSIRQAVATHHELHIHDVRLMNPGDIPRTTSGKIRHFLCKTNYMAEALKEIKST